MPAGQVFLGKFSFVADEVLRRYININRFAKRTRTLKTYIISRTFPYGSHAAQTTLLGLTGS